MKYLDFEKHMKKELGNAKEPVQMDALLASLDLGKKPKKKGFALWMIIPFLLLTISVFAWKYMDGFYGEDDEISLSQSSSADEGSSRMVTTAPVVESDQVQDSDDFNNKMVEAYRDIPNKTPFKNIKQNNSEKLAFDSNENTSNKKITNLTTAENYTAKSMLSDLNLSKTKSSSKSAEASHTENSSSHISEMDVNTATGQEAKATSMRPLIASSERISRNALDIRELSNAAALLEDAEVDGNLFSRMKINCPSFDNIGWNIALMPEVGAFLPFKTLENTVMEQSAAFNERRTSERTLEGLQIGLYGMLVRDNSPFFIKAGLSYSRISERMNLQYEYVEQDTTIGIISSTVSSNGDTITHIYGDIITETTFKGSNRQHHYIHIFDIPISVGYTTYLGGLDIGIEGGVRVNFMTRATGNLLTSASEYTNLSLNRLFKNRVGLSYFGGLMIGRNFGRFGDFYVAPRFTYFPDQFNNENNSVSQKYFTIGLNAGVVYKIK